MHSTVVRLQNVFSFFTTVAFCVAAVIALSSFINPQVPTASIRLRDVQVYVRKGRPFYYSQKKEEYAYMSFDLDADLSTLFNWNTKQVFVYVKAVYPSHKPGLPDSEAIIWDAILPSASAPWHQNHYIHPSPKGSQKKPKKNSKDNKGKSQAEAWPHGQGILHLTNQRPKYQITDFSGKLANRTSVRLELGWNVQPWVGALVWENKRDFGMWKALEGGVSERFNLPAIGKKVDGRKLEMEKGKEGHRLEVGGEYPIAGKGKRV
ncbi:signal peptidase 22 kDa subunit [Westerdykella ornata]|uniref:Signal peptidase subunit 3 n=1 Tax=Westerdykella ornata TaxID=318751 RepID=A0A6A6JJ08_WESOR|nr:signal peptidase 22 kDa subunit [Westerdykella ornata]KAF2276442.1 signal peptidase 22 kDa subunit [Westerdykella ornata]